MRLCAVELREKLGLYAAETLNNDKLLNLLSLMIARLASFYLLKRRLFRRQVYDADKFSLN